MARCRPPGHSRSWQTSALAYPPPPLRPAENQPPGSNGREIGAFLEIVRPTTRRWSARPNAVARSFHIVRGDKPAGLVVALAFPCVGGPVFESKPGRNCSVFDRLAAPFKFSFPLLAGSPGRNEASATDYFPPPAFGSAKSPPRAIITGNASSHHLL